MIDVKVTNAFFSENLMSNSNKTLREGVFLKAKVMESNGDDITLILENGEILEAKTNINLGSLKSKLLTFLVKSIEDNKIFLQPINQEDLLSSNIGKESVEEKINIFINKVLDIYNLPKTVENEYIIKTILSLKMPLSQDNIIKTIKYLDKINSLINLGNEEEIITIDSGISPLNDSIMRLIKVNSNSETAGSIIDMSESVNSSFNDLTNMAFKETEIGSSKFTNVTEMLNSKIESIFHGNTTSINIINKTVMLMNLGYEVSIDNYESLTKLSSHGEGIIRSLLELVNHLMSYNQSDNILLNEDMDLLNEINISTINLKDDNAISKDNIKSFLIKINSVFELIQSATVNRKNLNKETNSKLESFLQNIKLFHKINSYYPFIQLPIEFSEKNSDGNITILKKKNKYKKNSYVFYISINTKNLRKVDVLCNVTYEKIILDFIVEKEFIGYFSGRIKDLKKSLERIGYGNILVNFKEDIETDLTNLFIDDDLLLNYNINIRV